MPERTWFDELYAAARRPSVPPERLLKAKGLPALHPIRSANLLMEALDHNRLFRWGLDLHLLDPLRDHSTFAKNPDRLLAHPVAAVCFTRAGGPERPPGPHDPPPGAHGQAPRRSA